MSIAPIATLVTALATDCVWCGVAVGAGCVLGVIVSPDLDVDGRTYSETVLPTLLKWIWYVYWWPYSRMFKHRESSHWVIIGTAVRFLYLLGPICIMSRYIFGECFFFNITMFWVFVGLCVSDIMHITMDFV